ncbi:PolC-type DNA polymerase III [Hydrogenibacillus sp. N12]|uniref:PolC-type DNA polymerase III n=1 Tax=Hydrogenibacillus sp. N12 TaxID=2866627 RepID=UPI001C7D779E|nr:PolC-type DNA polymerase III [Hydrogenibacillus sp. N12]QZA33532.1 PolC-type DNA polymerase III [Hydrogenibacillus sp. N12]
MKGVIDPALGGLMARVPPEDKLSEALQAARLERLVVYPDARRWVVQITAPALLPAAPLIAWEAALGAAFRDVADVELWVRIEPPPPFQAVARGYGDALLGYLAARHPLLAAAVVDVAFEAAGDGRAVLYVEPAALPAFQNGALKTLRRFFAQYVGRTPEVVVLPAPDDAARAAARRERLAAAEEAAIASVAERTSPSDGEGRPPAGPRQNGNGAAEAAAEGTEAVETVLFGRPIAARPVALRSVAEGEDVAVEGVVFAREERPTRTGAVLLLKIADGESALAVKLFLRKSDDAVRAAALQEGVRARFRGRVAFDPYERDLVLTADDVVRLPDRRREDRAPKKRVELHLHTAMSAMDAPLPVAAAVRRAAEYGHAAVAITDHGVVQAYPEAYAAGEQYGVKILYGLEAYLVDDETEIVFDPDPERRLSDDTYVVFDVETTGLSSERDTIIEIGAVKIEGGREVGAFHTFVDPGRPLPAKIVELTGITDAMLRGAPTPEEALARFRAFIDGATLVAHNARFDLGFLRAGLKRAGLHPFSGPAIDTLGLARLLLPDLKNHRLDTLAEHFGVALERHHRAVDDARATAEIFLKLLQELAGRGITTQGALAAEKDPEAYAKVRPKHATLWATSEAGLQNLYRLVTKSHLETFHRVPRITKRDLEAHREGLLVGSGCDEGELFDAAMNEDFDSLLRRMSFYDVVEVMPPDVYLARMDLPEAEALPIIRQAIERLIAAAEVAGKPVVATGNVHHLDPEDVVFRRILLANQNGPRTRDPNRIRPQPYRTTEEMLEAFAFLGREKAEEIVIHQPTAIAEAIPSMKPFPDGLFTPVIDGAEDEIRRLATERARAVYGDPLPAIVAERLERELRSIIDGGFAVVYLIAQKLVKKSLEDGYLVGSRGSVGSSLVATMLGITEVNPLPPHYVCPSCHYSAFVEDGSVKDGYDLPEQACPVCGTPLHRDGHDIPFETFMGFKGDKVPDIDLNFSGEYQAEAHRHAEAILGRTNVFRAGTISTVAEKTAYGFVRKYLEERGENRRKAEIDWLARGTAGVKRTTGQHPGGLIVVPRGEDVHRFTPLQRPADDPASETITTHFDYHALSDRLLKLDLLGHDDPTVLRMLNDLTGIDPRTVPPTDPTVMALFSGTEPLGPDVGLEAIDVRVGTLGLPEFGTRFVRGMLEETRPTTFAELVQISGLSHGTDVWVGNAQELIRSGVAELKDVIGCRDDIMLYLIGKGLEPQQAFRIMESVRKGKGVPPDDQEAMRAHGVPAWYIDSCQKIKYMFPKAHAVAYVLMAVRIAYFKVYHPLAFYATYFSIRADEFDLALVLAGEAAVREKIAELMQKGSEASAKEKNLLTVLEVAYEMLRRGFRFLPLDLERSDAFRFIPEGDGLLVPFTAVDGLGEAAAESIVRAREDGPFLSVEDFHARTRVSKTVVDALRALGAFAHLPETNQMTLF